MKWEIKFAYKNELSEKVGLKQNSKIITELVRKN